MCEEDFVQEQGMLSWCRTCGMTLEVLDPFSCACWAGVNSRYSPLGLEIVDEPEH